eukprot:scaffold44388_cov63-Phaeocystis_antarctica.AAC.9
MVGRLPLQQQLLCTHRSSFLVQRVTFYPLFFARVVSQQLKLTRRLGSRVSRSGPNAQSSRQTDSTDPPPPLPPMLPAPAPIPR